MSTLRPVALAVAVAAAVGAGTVPTATAAGTLEPRPYDERYIQFGSLVPGVLVEQYSLRGVGSVWTRSSDAGIRILDTALTEGHRPACNLRLQVEGAAPDAPPLREWRAPEPSEGAAPCSGIAPTGEYPLPGPWPSGRTKLELRASQERHPTEPGTLLAVLPLGIDDTPPTMSWPGTPTIVPGGTRVRVLPDTADPESGVSYHGFNVHDDLGRPLAPENEGGGTVVVAPGRTVTVDMTVRNGVGIEATGRRSVVGLPGPSVGASPLRTVPSPSTGSGTSCSRAGAVIRVGTWRTASRRLTFSGCRTDRHLRDVQVRAIRRGRTITRRHRLPARGLTFAATVRVRSGDRPRAVRVGRSGRWSAWTRVTTSRR